MTNENESDDHEMPIGYLRAALAAGAHAEYVAFVAEYPDSPTADGLRRAISMDVLDEFESFAGSFEASLWRDGASKASNADTSNAERMRELFDDDQLPEVVRDGANA